VAIVGGSAALAVGALPVDTPQIAALGDLLAVSALCAVILAEATDGTHERDRDRSARLDAAVLVLVAALACWPVLLAPLVDTTSVAAERRIPLGLVAALSFAAIATTLWLALSGALDTPRRRRTSSAGTTAALAGLLHVAGAVHGDVPLGAAVFAAVAAVAIALVDLRRRDVDRRPAPSPEWQEGRVRLLAVAAATFVPQVMLAIAFVDRPDTGPQTMRVAAGIALCSLALVTIRMWGMLDRVRRHERTRSTQRFSAIVHHATDAILLADRHGTITYASPSVEPVLGVTTEQVVGGRLGDWLPDVADAATGLVGRGPDHVAGTEPSNRVAGVFTHPSAGRRHYEGLVRDLLDDPTVRAVVVSVRDVTARHELEHRLERRSLHDELTGLGNRSWFSSELATRVGEHRRDEPGVHVGAPHVAVLFVDLDEFEQINSALGHHAGDEMIRRIAERLDLCVGARDLVARVGGDEFAVLLDDVPSIAVARRTANRILEMLAMPIALVDGDGTPVELGVQASIGLATGSWNTNADELLRNAQIALSSAKGRGGGATVVFDERMRSRAEERFALKVHLPEALRAEQFRVLYQPIVRVGPLGPGGELDDPHDVAHLHGFEALIRWHHPVRGEVPPDEFVGVAEQTGIIVDIGRWVLEEACRTAVIWNVRLQRRVHINVNVSAVQLHHAGFVDDVRGILDTTGLTPGLLTLELTESVLVEHDRVEPVLHRLRAMGVEIAVDDFGTGYSSLAYLQRFPVTSVKVDRSFVSALSSRSDPALVRSIVAVADALHLTPVAEGVETAAQFAQLAGLGCELAQGYWIGTPLDAAGVDTAWFGAPAVRDERHAPDARGAALIDDPHRVEASSV
jgi:diguanylate cyclase (GGDEF)-like protein/PAS domain S-box-containing protein